MPSSVIAAFDYAPQQAQLDVVFVSGRRYRYHRVPARVVEAMERAASKGQYFNQHIRDHFSFTREDR